MVYYKILLSPSRENVLKPMSSTKSVAVVNFREKKHSVEIREIPIPEIGEERHSTGS